MSESIHEQARTQFAKTSDAYVTSGIHAKGDDLPAMLRLAGDVSGKRVLDIATGGGHTALAFAKAGAKVIATDLTPEMLETAERFITEQGVRGVTFREAEAEALPFENEAFDIVTCRIAAHHFADPEAFVSEVARVLKPGGVFLLIDNVAPEDSELAKMMNRIEKTRDPSHVEAYSTSTWIGWLSEQGLEPYYLKRLTRHKDFATWTARAQTPDEVVKGLERDILKLPEAAKRYFNVVEEAGELTSLSHEAVLLEARKLV